MVHKARCLLAFLLTMIIIFFNLPLVLAEAPAEVTLADLQTQYPHGMYWNGGDPLSYTDTPCTHHGNCSGNGTKYDGSCGCNTFRKHAIQCMGYAFQLAALIYGGDPYLEWTPYYGEDALDTLEAGDIVRYKGHSIFVYRVDGETVTFTDCNAGGTCNIRWDQTITKEELRADFKYVNRAPEAWKAGFATCSCSVIYAGEYTCTTETFPLNIRGGHGTSYSIVGSIPPGTTVTVSKATGDTHADWAHVEYDGIRGYASMEYLKNNHEHFYAADCDTNCDCGTLRESEVPHTFGEYTYNEDATYLIDGTQTRLCALCSESETVPAEGTQLPNPFTDVAEESYYTTSVLWALEQSITTGTTETTFGPDESCTRAQIVAFLWRAADCPTPQTTQMPFLDITEDAYYYDAVLWALENGITTGTAETAFTPDATCTRGQIVTFLWRSEESPVAVCENPFTDVEAEAYYMNAVLWAVENGITTGTTETTFSPEEPCSRGQSVTFLDRCISRGIIAEEIIF
ncbi:MAG: S-layer homology domain-containing protein [Clostridia bacterium]|nr:S-layer homology domain-containing protein [Clostridia bacterium]